MLIYGAALLSLAVTYQVTQACVPTYEQNEFRYRAKVDDAKGAEVGRWAWDVFLVTVP